MCVCGGGGCHPCKALCTVRVWQLTLCKTLDPFPLDLVCYCHMCRDDLEVCRQYTDIIYSLVARIAWYMVFVYVWACVGVYVS